MPCRLTEAKFEPSQGAGLVWLVVSSNPTTCRQVIELDATAAAVRPTPFLRPLSCTALKNGLEKPDFNTDKSYSQTSVEQ